MQRYTKIMISVRNGVQGTWSLHGMFAAASLYVRISTSELSLERKAGTRMPLVHSDPSQNSVFSRIKVSNTCEWVTKICFSSDFKRLYALTTNQPKILSFRIFITRRKCLISRNRWQFTVKKLKEKSTFPVQAFYRGILDSKREIHKWSRKCIMQ